MSGPARRSGLLDWEEMRKVGITTHRMSFACVAGGIAMAIIGQPWGVFAFLLLALVRA